MQNGRKILTCPWLLYLFVYSTSSLARRDAFFFWYEAPNENKKTLNVFGFSLQLQSWDCAQSRNARLVYAAAP